MPGYGWIFPLSDGEVNLGVGALATAKRPADLQIRPLMEHYAKLRRDEWGLGPDLRMPTSALLPMGGAVSGVSGPNWALIGDAAACVAHYPPITVGRVGLRCAPERIGGMKPG